MSHLQLFAVSTLSFLLGSIPAGYIIAKLHGIDIRKHGSGNIGATNVYRTLGAKAGAATLICDLLKGTVAVLLTRFFFKNDPYAQFFSAFFAVLGHDFSIFLKLKGGKGVATSYGATLPLAFWASFSGMIVWILILIGTKYSSLAALFSFSLTTLLSFVLYKSNYVHLLFVILWFLMIIKHKENIKRLYLRQENRLKI